MDNGLPAQQKFDDLVDYSRQQIAEMPLQVVGNWHIRTVQQEHG